MSYDLYLVRVTDDMSPAAIAAVALAATEAELPTGGPSGAAEMHKQAIAAALRHANSVLEPFTFDHAEIARLAGISVDEARRRFRHIELNGAADGNGIQITVYDDWGSITLPYWHRGSAADAVWAEAWSYLEVLEGEGGFTVYDPQLDRPLVLTVDRSAVQRAYADGVEFAARAAAGAGAASVPKKLP